MKMGAFDFVRKEQLPFNLKIVVDSALKASAELKAANTFNPCSPSSSIKTRLSADRMPCSRSSR